MQGRWVLYSPPVQALSGSLVIHIRPKSDQNLEHVVHAEPGDIDIDDNDDDHLWWWWWWGGGEGVEVFCLAAQMMGVFCPSSVDSRSSFFAPMSSAFIKLYVIISKQPTITSWFLKYAILLTSTTTTTALTPRHKITGLTHYPQANHTIQSPMRYPIIFGVFGHCLKQYRRNIVACKISTGFFGQYPHVRLSPLITLLASWYCHYQWNNQYQYDNHCRDNHYQCDK